MYFFKCSICNRKRSVFSCFSQRADLQEALEAWYYCQRVGNTADAEEALLGVHTDNCSLSREPQWNSTKITARVRY